MAELLGRDSDRLVNADTVQGEQEMANFATAFNASHQLVGDPNARLTLEVGTDQWPFPIPLVKNASGWQFDTILCLARGGMRPGDILSRIFDKPLAIMSTSSYRAEAGTVQGHLDLARYITTPRGEIAGRVLLVDDLADSGHTLSAVVKMLRENYPAITELRTAVIWTKGVSSFTPDYSVETLPSNPWIHQPFEGYDSLTPEKLLQKWKV